MPKSGVWKNLGLLQLTQENNLASWWSGTLLVLAACHAFDGFVLHRDDDPRASRAWACFAGVFVFLSMDEMGSVHERIGVMIEGHPWWTNVPLAIPVGGAVLYALYGL